MSLTAENPRVSVIVPVYNAENTLENCILSLLQSDFPETERELIFVNNESTDRTPIILERYADRIRVIHEKKRGPAAARNAGLRVARGVYAAFTDADCIVSPDWLKKILVPLEQQEVGIAGGMISAKEPLNDVEKFCERMNDHSLAIGKYRPSYAITMNWSSRISLLQELNFFDERFRRCEDVDLAYRILQSGYRIVYEPQAIVYHCNIKTLPALFWKGILHGFYSVQVLRRHSRWLRQFGHRKFQPQTYRDIYTNFRRSLSGKDAQSTCFYVFNSGKKCGKIFGSFRFFYPEL